MVRSVRFKFNTNGKTSLSCKVKDLLPGTLYNHYSDDTSLYMKVSATEQIIASVFPNTLTYKPVMCLDMGSGKLSWSPEDSDVFIYNMDINVSIE